MIKYYPNEELCKKVEVSILTIMAVIPETPFSGGVPPELTHRVLAVPAFNMIEYYPNKELCIKLEVSTPFSGGVPPE